MKGTAKIENPRELLALSQQALGVLGTELAELVGVSKRTVIRWHAGHSSIAAQVFGHLAVLVYPKDPVQRAHVEQWMDWAN